MRMNYFEIYHKGAAFRFGIPDVTILLDLSHCEPRSKQTIKDVLYEPIC